MKKKSRLRVLDIYYIFIVLSFFILALNDEEISSVRITSIFIGVLLLVHFIFAFRNRMKLQRIEKQIIEANYVIEDLANEKERKIFNKLNGNALERSLFSYLKNQYKDIVLFRNIKIPSTSNKNTEIDVLAIINNRMFVFECKNFNVELDGNWQKDYLVAHYSEPKKIKNPVKQNEFHINVLEKVLFEGRDYYGNIVVFGKDTKFPFIKPPTLTQVCKLHYIDKAIKNLKVNELDNDTKNEVIEVLKEFEI